MTAIAAFFIVFFFGASTLEVPSLQNLAAVIVAALLVAAVTLVVQAARGAE